ncbi:BZ3501_MvSof-1269-A2-R1_Chr12-3g03639 [Microbotryum saponariae]|nr:BZ3501_MvSof-1269-A2-R1_Chr12-3g03639 [Microbotryum saponariae]
MAVCAHCKARHWECKGRTGHFSTCCLQGKVQLPPLSGPIPSINSYLKARIANARSYNNALSFTSLAAHFDQIRLGTLGPPCSRTWLIDPVEATDTRLGPNSPDRRIQRSTLTKLESKLRTNNRFVRLFALTKVRADRRTHNLPTSSTEMAILICDSDTNTGDRGRQDLILQVHGDRCPEGRPKYQVVGSLHPSAMPLRYPLLCPAGEDGFHPNIPLCGFHQAGPPIARNREQIDNGVQLREVLAGLGLDDEDVQEDEDRDDEDEDGEEGDEENGDGERQVKGSRSRWRVSRSQFFAHYLPKVTSTSQSRIAPNVPSWTIPGCDGVRCQTWKASAAHHDDVRPRLTGNQGCTGAIKHATVRISLHECLKPSPATSDMQAWTQECRDLKLSALFTPFNNTAILWKSDSPVITIDPESPPNTLRASFSFPDRVTDATFRVGDSKVRVVAPSSDKPDKKRFLSHLSTALRQVSQLLDSENQKGMNYGGQEMRGLATANNIFDVYRLHHPKGRDMTNRSAPGTCRRLDRIYVSPDWVDLFHDHKIWAPVLKSTHSMVVARFQVPGAIDIGPGKFKLGLHVIEGDATCEYLTSTVRNLYNEALLQTPNDPTAAWMSTKHRLLPELQALARPTRAHALAARSVPQHRQHRFGWSILPCAYFGFVNRICNHDGRRRRPLFLSKHSTR